MNPTRLRVRAYDLRLRRGIRLGYAELEKRAGFIATLDAADPEHVGLGEAAPAWWVGDEPLDVTRSVLGRAQDWFSRKHPNPSELEEALRDGAALPDDLTELLGPSPAAYAALATALADRQARRLGKSLTEYLGGRPGSCPTNALVVAEDRVDVANEVGRAIALDYRLVKLKVGNRDVEADLARVDAALAAGHGRIGLRLDANRAWTADEAARFLSRLDPDLVEYIEEPVAEATPQSLAELRSRCEIDIALDESILCDEDVDRFAEFCTAIVIKPSRLEGPWSVLRRAKRATALGLSVTMTDSLESCVGRATCLHLARALSTDPTSSGLAGAAFLHEDLAREPQALRGASIEIDGPGLFSLDILSPGFLT